jgi:hypothetical protein
LLCYAFSIEVATSGDSLLMLNFLQEMRLWLSSAECLVDAYVVLLRKLANAHMVLLSAFFLNCPMKCCSDQYLQISQRDLQMADILGCSSC